jgi:hypothetical protein
MFQSGMELNLIVIHATILQIITNLTNVTPKCLPIARNLTAEMTSGPSLTCTVPSLLASITLSSCSPEQHLDSCCSWSLLTRAVISSLSFVLSSSSTSLTMVITDNMRESCETKIKILLYSTNQLFYKKSSNKNDEERLTAE